MTDAARALLADAFGIAPDAVPDDARLGHPASWDSIGHMRLVLALEERLGRPLDSDQMMGLDSAADVARMLGD